MTTPKINTISRSGSRFYVEPTTAEKVPGVTSIVGMLPKPFLTNWAAKMAAEFAVDNLGAVQAVARNDRQGAVDLIKGAHRRFTGEAADMGTSVHELYDRLAHGETLGAVHPDYDPYLRHWDAFVKEFKPEFVFMEETVWSDAHKYAGSFDAYANIDGERVWVDYKTTRSGVHNEVALQLAAYRYADHILRPDGSKVPNPEADAGAVLHVRPEGWSLVPVDCGERAFETFLHLRAIFDWDKDFQKAALGNPVNAEPYSGSIKRY